MPADRGGSRTKQDSDDIQNSSETNGQRRDEKLLVNGSEGRAEIPLLEGVAPRTADKDGFFQRCLSGQHSYRLPLAVKQLGPLMFKVPCF